MHITRRDFLKVASTSAMTLLLSRLDLLNLEHALVKAAPNKPVVIWLSGSGCTGCSVSLLNSVNPTIDQVLIETIDLAYHPTLMAASGDLAVSAARSAAQAGGYILVVEGAIPTGVNENFCYVWDEGGERVTMASATASLAANASLIVAVGTCASFGGVSGACSPNARGVQTFLGKPVVNLPGCPAHPDWIIGTLALAIGGTLPELDSYGRPRMFYPAVSCENCPRSEREEASRFGQNGLCLEELGCRGPHTYTDCPIRKWNNGQGWCVGVNSPCIGCTEPSFPSFPLRSPESD
jgi:hydrogenase small subunit